MKSTTDEMNAVYQYVSQLIVDDAIMMPMSTPSTSAIAQADVAGIDVNSFLPPIVRMQGVKQELTERSIGWRSTRPSSKRLCRCRWRP